MKRTLLFVPQTKHDLLDAIATLPNWTITKGQKTLKEKHGTPLEFAKCVVESIGEISVPEAIAAIKKYKEEWLCA